MSQKVNWKLFWKESSILIAHTLLAGFYLRVALALNDYYKNPVLASVFFLVTIAFAVPLAINLLDLWARTVASVREEALAEKLLKFSINVHQKLFGKNNTYMSEKQAMLASTYYDLGKEEEAETAFSEAWQTYKKSSIKLPWLHACFADYVKLLNTKGDTTKAKEVETSLKAARLLTLAQRFGTVALTAPIVVILLMTQATERSIAKLNAHGQVIVALKQVATLAKTEAMILGPYASAKVYADYAEAFDALEGQKNEMLWCTEKALNSLNESGTRDDYLKVVLLNLSGKAYIIEGKYDEAQKCLMEAVDTSSNWDLSQLGRNAYEAGKERDQALITLGELKRNSGDYAKAEELYKQVMGLDKNANVSRSTQAAVDPIETIDRLHRLQHIETRLGKKDEAIKMQKQICEILEGSIQGLTVNNKNSAVCDFGMRETSRELDVCSIMLQENGQEKEAKDYKARADLLRSKQGQKTLRLDAGQQDSIVDATTRITNELLAVKYHSDDFQQSLNKLFHDELKSKRALGAFERLPWYDSSSMKPDAKLPEAPSKRHLEVEIAPLSIKNSREGDGLMIDVQGTVRIITANKSEPEEQKFGFAYVIKDQKTGKPSVEDLLDNQALSRFQLD